MTLGGLFAAADAAMPSPLGRVGGIALRLCRPAMLATT